MFVIHSRFFCHYHFVRLKIAYVSGSDCVVAFVSQSLNLSDPWRSLLLECLVLFTQAEVLARFVDTRADDGGERGPDDSFLHCGHGDGFGGGEGG